MTPRHCPGKNCRGQRFLTSTISTVISSGLAPTQFHVEVWKRPVKVSSLGQCRKTVEIIQPLLALQMQTIAIMAGVGEAATSTLVMTFSQMSSSTHHLKK